MKTKTILYWVIVAHIAVVLVTTLTIGIIIGSLL